MPAGILLKTTTANELNLIMRYLEMRHEASSLTKAEHDVVKSDKRLQKYLKTHALLKAKKAMDKENEAGHEAALTAHKLVINDFVCIKVLEKLAQEASAEVDRLEKEVKKGKAGMPRKTFRQFQDEKVKFEQGEAMSIRHLLQSARRILDGLMKKAEGKVDMAFLVKRKFFIDSRLLNYFKLRFEARAERKNINKVKKALQEVHKETRLIEHKKRVRKASEDIVKSLHKLNDAVKKAIQEAFKVFMNSTLLLDIVIGIIATEKAEDVKLVQKHQIPIMMGQHDEEVKKSLLTFIQRSIKDMNVARLQLQL